MNRVRTLFLTVLVLLAAVGAGVGLAGAVPADTAVSEEPTAEVGPLQDNVTVTLVGDEDPDDGPATIAMFADELPSEFDTQYRSISAVDDTVVATTDVFVVYNVGTGANGTALIETIESDIETGAVYIDQWGSDVDGIPDRSGVLGDPADTDQDDDNGGPAPEWVVQQDHPIFDGVANASETITIHSGSFADHTWFTGASAETLAEVDQGFGGPEGAAIAVDNDSGSVLLSSIGVAFPDASEYTAEANQTFANAVEFAEPPELEGPYFSVSDLSAPAVAPTGAEINVSATVENIGNQSDTQTVEFVLNGSVAASTTQTLAAGENTTVEFTGVSLPEETGTFEHGVQTANESQFATISVEEPFFAVSDLSAPRTADPGATIDVNATVTNTGNVPGEQDVEFVFDGSVAANTTQTLDAGENTTVEFSPTLPNQEGFFEHGVFTNDDSQTADIGVGAEFTDVAVVDSAEDDGDAPETENLFADDLSPRFNTEVVASADILPNNLTAEYDIFVVQGIDEDTVNVTELVTTIEEDVTTGAVYLDQGGFSDTYGITDRSDAIGAPGETAEETDGTAPAEYVIQQDHPIFDGVGTAGDTVNITADGEDNRAWFSNAAGETLAEVGDQTGVDGAAVAVDPNSGAVLLSSIMVTTITDPGELSPEAGQILANAVEFAEPPDLEGPFFQVSNLSAPAVGAVSEQINVSATVENIGNQSGEQMVEFVFDGTALANTTVQLDSGANTTVEFSPTLPDEGGEFQHGIATANTSQVAGITVEAPFFAVSDLSAPAEAGTGDEINVSATITNTGNVSGTQTVEFVFDGTAVANTTETLNAGENTTVEFSPTLPGQDGFFEHGVFTDDDSQTAEIGVGVEFTDVAVVENPSGDGDAAGTVSMFADKLPAGFTVEIVSSADVLSSNLTDEYDVFLVQDIDEDTVAAADLVNTIENDMDTGAIYLAQSNFGDTFGIEDRSDAIGDPGETDDTTTGEEPTEYLIQQDHPIFDGVGSAGDSVNITDGEDNRAWFNNATGLTLADVGDQTGVDGTGVTVDADSQVVLLSSIMAHNLDSPGEFTAAANQTLANAVEFIDPAETAPDFRVSNLDAPAQAGAGTIINVSATVTNVGLEAGTQTVEFVFDGSVVANTTETLNASESTTVEFNPTLPGTSGTFEHGVQTANDSQTANITVVKGSDFQVSNLSAPAEAVPGAEIDVSATVTNVGSEAGTQTVEFVFDGSVVANTTETLNDSESTVVEFTGIPLPDVEDTFEHGVFTDNDSQTANITVRPEPVTVTVVEDGSEAYGDDVLALIDSQLPADGYETQVIGADGVDDTVVAETEVFVFNDFNISAGAGDTRQRTDDTLLASAGAVSDGATADTVDLITSVEADVTTNAVYLDQWGSDSDAIPDRASATGDPAETFQAFESGTDPVEYVIQQDHPLFDGVGSQGDVVAIHTANFADHTWFEGAAGDTLATVQNQFGSGGPAVAVDPDSGSVLLSSLGATSAVGEAEYTTAAAQILANGVEVAEPPEISGAFFDVSGLTAPTETNASATINVSATVTNVGNESGTQTVEFVFGGSVAATVSGVELDPGNETTVEFNNVQLPSEGGVFEHGVQTANDSQTASITVGSPDIELVELVQPGKLTLDGDIVTEITVTNNGTAPYEGEVLQVTNLNDTAPESGAIGFPNNVTELTLAPGENATFSDNLGTFAEINAQLGTDFEPGDDVETGYWKGQNLDFTEDPEPTIEDVFSEEISIVEEAFFEVSDLAAPEQAPAGSSINVSATVTNTGGVAASQAVEFQFDGQTVANTTVELNASASTTVEFSDIQLPEEGGTFAHGVFTEDDDETAEIAVGSVFFAVSDLDAPTEADAGATIDVSATINNTGGLSGVQDVLFQFDGSTVTTKTVSLNATENTTVEFSDVTLPNEDAVFEHGVQTANDSQTALIAVGDSEIKNLSVVESDSFAEPGQGDETLAIFEEFLPTRFQPSVVEVQTIDDALIESTDVFAFHDFGVELNDTDIEDIMTDVETDPMTNAIYLEQRISSNAISERSDILGDPNESPLNDNNGETPVEYAIQTDHPIFDGVGGPGDTVEIHSGGNGGFSWFEGTAGDTLAEVQDQSVVGGPAVAVDPDSGAVLLASIATTDLFGEPAITTENYTDDAGQILANAVAFAEPEPEPAFLAVSNLTAPTEATSGAQINVSATITNVGDLAGTGTVEFVFDGSAVANTTIGLNASASTTVEFSPTLPEQTGTVTHGVFTDDDNETAELTVVAPGPPNVTIANLTIAGQGNDVTVIQGSYNVSAEISHEDGPGSTVNMTLTIGSETVVKSIPLEVDETKTVLFEDVTSDVEPGAYDVAMSGSNASVTGSLTLSVDVLDNGDPATDTSGDDLLNDIDGDEAFDIFDVQALFDNLENPLLVDNPGLFNFNGDDPPEMGIFDVQALFEQLSAQD